SDRAVCARDLTASGAAELLPEDVGMRLGGSRRDAEPECNLVVRAPGGDQLDHLKLAIRDYGRSLMQDCDHVATVTTRVPAAKWPPGVTSTVPLGEYQLGSKRVTKRRPGADAALRRWT